MIKRNVVHEPESIAPGTGLEWPPGGQATSSVNVYAVCERIVCVHEVCLLELPRRFPNLPTGIPTRVEHVFHRFLT